MEIIILAATIGLITFLISQSNKRIGERTAIHKKIKYAYHGLRCYSRGLNKSESRVVEVLAEKLNTKDYYIFNNLILETSTGSTQVDHIIVSPYGIFVLETKDCAGWIFASENGKVWTQTFPNGEKHTFQNPLHQNYKHVKILEKYIPFVPVTSIKNIVVFTERSEFKTKKPDHVIYIHELFSYLDTFTHVVINKAIYFMAIGKLSQLCQSTDISPEKHVFNLNKEHINSDKSFG